MSVQIEKDKLEGLIKDFPDSIDIEDLMYRLYLLKKIEDGTDDSNNGQVVTHEEAKRRLADKWQS